MTSPSVRASAACSLLKHQTEHVQGTKKICSSVTLGDAGVWELAGGPAGAVRSGGSGAAGKHSSLRRDRCPLPGGPVLGGSSATCVIPSPQRRLCCGGQSICLLNHAHSCSIAANQSTVWGVSRLRLCFLAGRLSCARDSILDSMLNGKCWFKHVKVHSTSAVWACPTHPS